MSISSQVLLKVRVKEIEEKLMSNDLLSQERKELLKIAHQRIKDNPGKYINKVWGEHEVGGTSVLYLSDIDLGFLSYNTNLGTKPLPETTAPAMESVPFAFVGMGGVMLGLNWIIRRRMEMQKEKGKEGKLKNE